MDLPEIPKLEPGVFCHAQTPLPLDEEAEAADQAVKCLDSEGLLLAIVSNKTVQDATGLDRQGLLRKFSASWSAESAFREGE